MRALLAADLVRGDVTVRPTVQQAAALTGASSSYVHFALKLTDAERNAVVRGLVPIAGAYTPALPRPADNVVQIQAVA
jgi:hypothetical protein